VREQWIQQVLDEHEGPLLRYAYRLCGDLETARDAVQDTFMKLCREDRDKVQNYLVKWLFTVCRNRLFEIHRKEKKMHALTDWELNDTCDHGTSPDRQVEINDDVYTLKDLMKTLPPREQEVIRLKFQNGLSYKEISEITQMSVSHVGVLLHSTIKKLRTGFKKEALAAGGLK